MKNAKLHIEGEISITWTEGKGSLAETERFAKELLELVAKGKVVANRKRKATKLW